MVANNFIEISDDALNTDTCKELIDIFEYCDSINLTHEGSVLKIDEKGELITGVDKTFKKSHDLDLETLFNKSLSSLIQYLPVLHPKLPDILDDIDNILMNNIIKYLKKYMVVNKTEDSDISKLHPKSFLLKRYLPPDGGFPNWHMDYNPRADEKTEVHKRALVAMFYLNDVNEGGETEFYHQKIKIKPKQGRLVIFPASFTHMHRGNPVINNKKYILNSWIVYN